MQDWFAPRKAPPKRRYPTARVGNYEASVDTAGMDPGMKATMGFGAPDTTAAKATRGRPMGFWESIAGLFHPKK
jgi:hypothetical protein